MKRLAVRAIAGFAWLQVVLAAMLFLPAGSLGFWQAWLYLSLFFAATLSITLYFLRHDPALIERRMSAGPVAEQERSQKIIQSVAGVLWCALIVVPGLDHRFQWSAVPAPMVVSADVVFVLGFLLVFFVFRENSHAASVVTVETNQPVVSTGLYGVIRHPMYAGAMFAFIVTPVALGSWWGLLVAVPFAGVIVVRLLYEERYLSAHLTGYDAYCRHVRYRLLPRVW